MPNMYFIDKWRLMVTGLLLFSLAALGQKSFAEAEPSSSDSWESRIRQEMELDELTKQEVEEAVRAVSEQEIKSAFKSHDDFWLFITHPDTPFLHRLAAAERAYLVFDLSKIAVLAQALAELNGFSVMMDPAPDIERVTSGLRLLFDLPDEVLGYAWDNDLSDKMPYPLSLDAFVHMPLPWQLQKSLYRLWFRLKTRLTEPENRQIVLEAALKMPFATRKEEDRIPNNDPWSFLDFFDPTKIRYDAFLLAAGWITEMEPGLGYSPLYLEVLKEFYTYRNDPGGKILMSGSLGMDIVSNWHSREGYWLGYAFILSDSDGIIESLKKALPKDHQKIPATLFHKLAERVIYHGRTLFRQNPDSVYYLRRAEILLELVGKPLDANQTKVSPFFIEEKQKSTFLVRMEMLLASIEDHLEISREQVALEKPYLEWAEKVLTSAKWSAMPPEL